MPPLTDWHGGNSVASGSPGPDVSDIPAIALRRVEVLPDGTAAQYGSDAIAGVMHFQFKDASAGGSGRPTARCRAVSASYGAA